MADTPDWLKTNEADLALSNSGSTDLEEGSPTSSSKQAAPADEKENDSSGRGFSCSCGAVLILLISTAFLAVFVYSATTQNNDTDKVQWMLFYSFSSVLVALFMVHYMCCFPTKAFYALAVAMAIWSIVIIVMTAIQFKDTEKGGSKEGTGDNDNQTLKQELGYELGGASLSLLSSLYHMIVVRCCVNKGSKDE